MKLSLNNRGRHMTRDEIEKILELPIPWKNEAEEERVQKITDLLDDDEVILAAQSSYAYWFALLDRQHKTPSHIQTRRMAEREVRRHCSKVLDDSEALSLVKETCKYRKDYQIHMLRSCFIDMNAVIFDNETEKLDYEKHATKLSTLIENDLQKQEIYVRGTDIDGRALLIGHSRIVGNTIDEEFLITQIYMMERAIATTEYNTMGILEKIVVIFDYNDFYSSRSPSLDSLLTLVRILQKHYPERLHRFIVINPPFWMRAIYITITPFMNIATQEKFIVVSGRSNDDKENILSKYISNDQAMPFILPNGKLIDPVDVQHFCDFVPFNCLYDDNKQKS